MSYIVLVWVLFVNGVAVERFADRGDCLEAAAEYYSNDKQCVELEELRTQG